MNTLQKRVGWVGLAVFVFMGVFPPGYYPTQVPSIRIWGHNFIDNLDFNYLDIPVLITQWVILLVLVVGSILLLKSKTPKEDRAEERRSDMQG